MGKRKSKDIKWRNSIQTRQMIGFTVIILFMIVSSVILWASAMNFAVKTTYEKMDANTGYFLQSFENDISYVHQLQIEFFNDRKITFLENPETFMNDYEEREALLSVREKLQTITGVSGVVKNGILCLPEANYWITPSGIKRIYLNERAQLSACLSQEMGKMHFDGSNFYIYQASKEREKSGLPRHILMITFSTESVREKMADLNSSEDGGSFFYFEEADYFLSYNQDQDLEEKIYKQLKTDQAGDYLGVQRIQIDGEWYLVCVGGTGVMGDFIQYTREAPIMRPMNNFRYVMVLTTTVMALMAAFFIIFMRRSIHRPITILLNAFTGLETGDWSTNIRHKGEDEFGQLYEGFNKMKGRIAHLIDELYIQTNLVQRAELKQLQAQINPHFLYNSFFILSRRIKRQDYDNAQIIADHLGEYFQFLTRNESDYIPLKKEAEHGRCYANIQAARFIDRITIEFGNLPENVEGILVPRLILQPLLENAFGHGLYNKAEAGILRVIFAETEDKVLVTVEDNGEELTDTELMKMQESLNENDNGEITGIVNIHKRLIYYFHGRGGLILGRSELGGLCITIQIDKGEWLNGEESADC